MDIAADVASEARMRAKSAGANLLGGLKGFSGEILKQVVGSGKMPPVSDEELAAGKKADDDFSDEAYLATRAKVQAIYDEYKAKRQREEQARQQQQIQQQETKKLEELNEKRVVKEEIATAVAKGSAETGRNWGAE